MTSQLYCHPLPTLGTLGWYASSSLRRLISHGASASSTLERFKATFSQLRFWGRMSSLSIGLNAKQSLTSKSLLLTVKSAKLVHHIPFQMLRRMDATKLRTADLMTMCFIMMLQDWHHVCHAQITRILMQRVGNVYPFLTVLHLEFLIRTESANAAYQILLLTSRQEPASRPIARRISTVATKVNAFPVNLKTSIFLTFKNENVKRSKTAQPSQELHGEDNVRHVPSTSSQNQRSYPAGLQNVHHMTL